MMLGEAILQKLKRGTFISFDYFVALHMDTNLESNTEPMKRNVAISCILLATISATEIQATKFLVYTQLVYIGWSCD